MKFTEEKAEELRKLWTKYTRREICQRLEICDNTLHHWVNKLQLEPKKKGRKKEKLEFLGD